MFRFASIGICAKTWTADKDSIRDPEADPVAVLAWEVSAGVVVKEVVKEGQLTNVPGSWSCSLLSC